MCTIIGTTTVWKCINSRSISEVDIYPLDIYDMYYKCIIEQDNSDPITLWAIISVWVSLISTWYLKFNIILKRFSSSFFKEKNDQKKWMSIGPIPHLATNISLNRNIL